MVAQPALFGDSMIRGKVSIIIPLYNQEQYIAQCLKSALVQTYKNYDITIVNDGSTDYSRQAVQEVIDEYTSDDNRTRKAMSDRIAAEGLSPEEGYKLYDEYFPNGERTAPKIIEQPNTGLSASRNRGFRESDGEFLLPLDADDWIREDYLEKTVPKMVADDSIGIVAPDMQYEGLLHHRIPPRGLTLEHEMQSNDLPVCSLIRRAAFDQTPGYEALFLEAGAPTGYEDWNLWIDILKRGWKVAVVNEPLFHYRLKPVSMITQAKMVHTGLVRLIHLLHPDLWPVEVK